MLQETEKPAEELFESPERKALRDGFGEALLELGKMDARVVALCGDVTESVRMSPFQEKYPERYIELGVAEQNMAAVASGLAAYGKIPFIASYAVFSPGRNWEQIRTTIALNNVPVKIAGMHAGVSVGPDGATHQGLEDIALMRTLPNMTVFSPCDAPQARLATLRAAQMDGPVYIRYGRENTPVMTTDDSPFIPGKVQVLWRPTDRPRPDVVIFATGSLVYEALIAARELEGEIGPHVTVANVHTIKPLYPEDIAALACEAGAVVTVEEHQIAGGLGGAIAECLAATSPMPIEFIGIHDRFGQSGTPEELKKEYGLTAAHIKEAVLRAHARRRL